PAATAAIFNILTCPKRSDVTAPASAQPKNCLTAYLGDCLMHRCALVLLAICLTDSTARAEDWPAWRGPRLDGTSAEAGLPIRWSQTENIRWKTAIPGRGHSSPIVWGDRVFVTTCMEDEGQRLLLCLDRREGKVLWQRVVLTAKLERKHSLNSF